MTKAAQLKQERAFRKMIRDSYAEKGEPISTKKAMELHKQYKKSSDTVKEKIRKQYLEGSIGWNLRHEPSPGTEGNTVPDEDVIYSELKPGEEVITDKSVISEKEYENDPYLQQSRYIGELKTTVKLLRGSSKLQTKIIADLQKQIKEDKSFQKRMEKRLKKLER